jgi:hypothetical protein
MSAKTFIRNIAGRLSEVFGVVTSAGAGNDGDIAALDASGRLDISLMPVGVAAEVVTVATTEDIAAGCWVNLFLSGGVLKARKADATTAGKEAQGFVLATTTSGQNAVVYLEGSNTSCSGLTIGTEYFLHTTAGGQTATAPSSSGNVVQPLGKATATTVINFIPSAPGHNVVVA